jgi:hypothetical protein
MRGPDVVDPDLDREWERAAGVHPSARPDVEVVRPSQVGA